MTRPLGTIQVDVDPFWFIASCYQGDSTPMRDERTIYETAIPVFLDALDRFGLKATFFVVGRDVEDNRNIPWLERMVAAGHELANHSYSHPIRFKQLGPGLVEEVDRCADLLWEALGVRPVGFKSPAYGVTPELLAHLVRQGYRYDSSVLPNSITQAVRLVQKFWLSYVQGSAYGALRSATAPLMPYRPGATDPYRRGEVPLWELPVSTMPLLRAPFHFSFVNVSSFGLYRLGRALQDLFRVPWCNYAFHAVDVLDSGQSPPATRRRLGLSKSSEAKRCHMDAILRDLSNTFEVLTSADVAARLSGQSNR